MDPEKNECTCGLTDSSLNIEVPFGASDNDSLVFEYTIPDGYEVIVKGKRLIVKKIDI